MCHLHSPLSLCADNFFHPKSPLGRWGQGLSWCRSGHQHYRFLITPLFPVLSPCCSIVIMPTVEPLTGPRPDLTARAANHQLTSISSHATGRHSFGPWGSQTAQSLVYPHQARRSQPDPHAKSPAGTTLPLSTNCPQQRSPKKTKQKKKQPSQTDTCTANNLPYWQPKATPLLGGNIHLTHSARESIITGEAVLHLFPAVTLPRFAFWNDHVSSL